jgi:GNAT superfamily N-acetyltransferase
VRAAVQRAAFDGSTFTDERWHAMAAGSPYAKAQCLVACDDQDTAVAAATVWSAGSDRPGLLEPTGVHRGHRGHGCGTAITVAAAAALRELGSSSAIVRAESSNVGAVATYKSAGFQQLPQVRDLHRSAYGVVPHAGGEPVDSGGEAKSGTVVAGGLSERIAMARHC